MSTSSNKSDYFRNIQHALVIYTCTDVHVHNVCLASDYTQTVVLKARLERLIEPGLTRPGTFTNPVGSLMKSRVLVHNLSKPAKTGS